MSELRRGSWGKLTALAQRRRGVTMGQCTDFRERSTQDGKAARQAALRRQQLP